MLPIHRATHILCGTTCLILLIIKLENIMQARSILLIASGEAKAEAMYQALFGPITPTVPASILQLHNNVSIVADETALSLIIKKNLI